MVKYEQMETLLDTLLDNDIEQNNLDSLLKVNYLSRFMKDLSPEDQEVIVKKNKLAFTRNPNFETIYAYKLSKKMLNS